MTLNLSSFKSIFKRESTLALTMDRFSFDVKMILALSFSKNRFSSISPTKFLDPNLNISRFPS